MPEFEVVSPFQPSGDQPTAITGLAKGVRRGDPYQTLQGITGSGKTATIAWMIEQVQRPTLIIEPNKSLAAQLSSELRELFPKNRVEFFVSYYDYYQPEAYLPTTDTYIEKDSSINDEIDRLRHATTSSLLMRRDVIVVASVSCIYGLGSPDEYRDRILGIKVGEQVDQRDMLRRLVDLQYARNDVNLVRGTFRARGDTVEIHPAYEEQALRVELFGDTVDRIVPFDVLTGEMGDEMEDVAVYAATHYVTGDDIIQRAVGLHRGRAAGAPAGIREGGQAARGAAPPGAHRARPRDAGRDRRVLGRRELQPPPRRPGAGRDAVHAAGLLPQGLPLRHRREPRRRPAAARAVRRRQVPQGRAGRARLPAALGQGQPAAALRGVHRAGAPVRLRLGDARGRSSSSTPTQVVEQVIRPTGLVDPEVTIMPTKGQVDDLLARIGRTVEAGGRVLVTTLTKKMAEDLTDYLADAGVRVQYLHSDIDTITRIEILRELRLGSIDVLVGINLLREGLDLPEVALVAILDADKEGFLRSASSLIQTMGRAARNVDGVVVLYADTVTDSMREAVSVTQRRREVQIAYNKEHGINPQTIRKSVTDILERLRGQRRRGRGHRRGAAGPRCARTRPCGATSGRRCWPTAMPRRRRRRWSS